MLKAKLKKSIEISLENNSHVNESKITHYCEFKLSFPISSIKILIDVFLFATPF